VAVRLRSKLLQFTSHLIEMKQLRSLVFHCGILYRKRTLRSQKGLALPLTRKPVVGDARAERYLAQAQRCEQLAKIARTGDHQRAEMYEYLACQWRWLNDRFREYELCKAALERRFSRIQTAREPGSCWD
jgi:hypothetical protein